MKYFGAYEPAPGREKSAFLQVGKAFAIKVFMKSLSSSLCTAVNVSST